MPRALAVVAFPIAAVAIDCHASPVAEGTPDAPHAPAGSTPLQPPSFTPQLPSPSPLQLAQEAAFAAAKAVLSNWNDATNAHDLGRLASLYDEQVFYYGAHLPKAAVLASKAKAFKIMRAYHQEISDVVSSSSDGFYFTKSWGPPDRPRQLRAKIGLRANDGGAYVIVEETDEPTESAKDPPSDECELFASKTVMHLPVVAKRVAAAEEETRPGVYLQDMGREPYGEGATRSTYGWGRGIVDEEIVAWVLRRNGEIQLTVDDAGVEVPPAARKAIKEACER